MDLFISMLVADNKNLAYFFFSLLYYFSGSHSSGTELSKGIIWRVLLSWGNSINHIDLWWWNINTIIIIPIILFLLLLTQSGGNYRGYSVRNQPYFHRLLSVVSTNFQILVHTYVYILLLLLTCSPTPVLSIIQLLSYFIYTTNYYDLRSWAIPQDKFPGGTIFVATDKPSTAVPTAEPSTAAPSTFVIALPSGSSIICDNVMWGRSCNCYCIYWRSSDTISSCLFVRSESRIRTQQLSAMGDTAVRNNSFIHSDEPFYFLSNK